VANNYYTAISDEVSEDADFYKLSDETIFAVMTMNDERLNGMLQAKYLNVVEKYSVIQAMRFREEPQNSEVGCILC
jgi:hypothetical protein